MSVYTQDVKIICQNHVLKSTAKASEGHPWRNWKIRVVAVDNNREKKGKLNHLLDHVEYWLHPTFVNPVRDFKKEPYLLQEKGWGEFDMRVILYFKDSLLEPDPEEILFDLHFREPIYTIKHTIIFNNPSPELIRILQMELPTSDLQTTIHIDNRKRRTSPTMSTSKKIKTPPSMSSPADGGPLPPAAASNNNSIRYPTSPSSSMMLYLHDHDSSAESDDLYRTVHGYRRQKRTVNQDGVTIDDIYNETDIENASSIHTKQLDDHLRKAWGIPMGVDMLELAKQLTLLTPEQIEEVEALILKGKNDNTVVEDNEDEFMFDLYSLGPELLSQLWDYTVEKQSQQKATALSPFSLVQANANM
ncbi:yeats family-domain-containing protein [Parasitella parasitica]|nr:yeats family-domain-containing protein [Parasitella parasitica]